MSPTTQPHPICATQDHHISVHFEEAEDGWWIATTGWVIPAKYHKGKGLSTKEVINLLQEPDAPLRSRIAIWVRRRQVVDKVNIPAAVAMLRTFPEAAAIKSRQVLDSWQPKK